MINGQRYMVIASDGSAATHNRRLIRTGHAYYIRDDEGTLKHAWYEQEGHDSQMAEYLAAHAALTAAQDRILPDTKLIYYCDNSTVISALKNSFVTKKAKKNHAYWIEEFKKLTSAFQEVEARHIPAHTAREDEKRYYLNRWCDFNARSMMKYKRLHQKRRYK